MHDLLETPEAQAEIASIRDVLELIHPNRFYLRAVPKHAGFERPVVVPADQILKRLGMHERSSVLGLFGQGLSNAADEPDVATAFISQDILPSADERVFDPWSPRGRYRKYRYKYFPLFHFDQEWRRVEKALSRRKSIHSHHPLGKMTVDVKTAPRVTERPTLILGMHFLEVGGAETFAIECARRAAQDFNVVIVTDQPSPHPLRSAFAAMEGVKIYHIDRHVPAGEETRFLLKLIERENAAAIQIHHCIALYEALPAIKLQFPHILVADTTHIIEHKDGGFARISGIFTNYIDCHHVISKDLQSYLTNEFDAWGRTELGYLHRGGEPPEHPRLTEIDPSKPIRFGFIGRMEQQKRPLLFVYAAAALEKALKARGLSARFSMMGNGSHLAPVKTLVKRLGLQDVVEFKPPSFGAERFLKDVDCHLLSSENEGLALVIFEALSSGTFVLASDVGAHREALPPEALLPPRPSHYVKALVERVLRLVDDPAFRRDLWQASLALNRQIAAAPQGHQVFDSFLARVKG